MMKFSVDKKVSFDDKTHSYFLKNKKLISVTSLINKFKNKFDSDYWSEVIAKRENKTKNEILQLWKLKANKSCEIGTAIHRIFEDYVNNDFCVINDKLTFNEAILNDDYIIDFNKKKTKAVSFINDFFITNRIIPIHSEFICYNDFIAGQVDMVCKDNDGNFYILDFKTNDKIDFQAFKNNKMIGYLDFIEDSSYWHYCLQLSIYKKLLKDYQIKKMYIIHITFENYSFIECDDLSDKIDLMQLI